MTMNPSVQLVKMAGVMERSFIEICGFERETVSRFREITINLGTAFNYYTVLIGRRVFLFMRFEAV